MGGKYNNFGGGGGIEIIINNRKVNNIPVEWLLSSGNGKAINNFFGDFCHKKLYLHLKGEKLPTLDKKWVPVGDRCWKKSLPLLGKR
jgi:hypothetical protein